MDNNDLKNFEFLKNYINENDVLVDVGANYGDYTNFFVNQLLGTGKIYSIELHPSTYNELKKRFPSDNNIQFVNAAISDTDSTITFYKGKDAWTHNIIGHDMDFKKNEILGEIESIRLDTLLENEEIINLIKIDVEGAEFSVLKGLNKILHKVNYIQVECHLDEDWNNIFDLLIKEYKLNCINILTSESISENSKRPYQCFCKK